MKFWTIQSREFGRFCGYQRKWMDLWLKRPFFRWDTFPQHGECMVFLYEEKAKQYLAEHQELPADCEVKFNDTGPRDGPVA
jgi:hypothetical protein